MPRPKRGDKLRAEMAEVSAGFALIQAARGHDYEPGDDSSPMQTDPPCRVCGSPKRSHGGWA